VVAGFATVTPNVLDRLMDRASRALVAMRYFEAERLCLRALDEAHRRRDYGRMARIIMPLQEARRQKRQIACDAGRVELVSRRPRGTTRPGCYLVQPPLVAMDARRFREEADRRRVPVFVLCREPLTEAGLWPVVAVGSGRGRVFPLVVRMLVAPPAAPERDQATPTRDAGDILPPTEWFETAAESLGDAAIASVDPALQPAWRVDDLMALLDAFPDHEKLHQRLEEACREALAGGPGPRFRPRVFGDANCF
jgi:hypothetical protein